MQIPNTLFDILNEDIGTLATYADHKAPLYPVPVLWHNKKLQAIYHLVQEDAKNENNRTTEGAHSAA